MQSVSMSMTINQTEIDLTCWWWWAMVLGLASGRN